MDATPSSPRLALRYAALSDVGRVRKDNQDSGFASQHLLVIADGVGGAARGDIASSTAVQILRRLDGPAPENMQEAVAGAIHRAHDRLAELVEEDPELEGTSTTVTAALFDGTKISVGHVGDSRGYLLRHGELRQLTADHTFVQSLIDEGRITEEESRSHPHRNLILRAVDGVHETEPDLFDVDLSAGDRLLLCSDGCSGVLDADRLADILGSGSIDFAVVELVRASLDAGSTDNITVVVADIVDADAPPADPETSAAASTGAMLVGAAAEQPRRAGAAAKSFFRGHRSGDTGELEPVAGSATASTAAGAGGGTAGDAAAADVDPETLRYAPRPPKRFLWLRRLVILAVLLALLVTGGVLAYNWSQTQYFVAVADDKVAIYRGVQADLPGITTHEVAQMTGVTMAALPEYRAAQVRAGIPADDLADAETIVAEILGFARVCPEPEPEPEPSPTAGEEKRDSRKDGRSGPSESPSPSPSASPTPTIAPPDCIEPSAGTVS